MRIPIKLEGEVWNVGGPEPLLRGKPYLTAGEIDRLGEEIRRLDPFGHLLSVHNATGDDLFRTIPFYRMKPRQDLCNRGFLPAEEGRRYLGYPPSGGAINNHRVSAGSFTVRWINARNPLKDQRTGGTTRDGRDLTAPDGNDWLVYLDVSLSEEPAGGVLRR